MIITKFAKQKIDNLKKNQSDLLRSTIISFPPETVKNLTNQELVGWIAGYVIEWVLKTGGNPAMFEDSLYEELDAGLD